MSLAFDRDMCEHFDVYIVPLCILYMRLYKHKHKHTFRSASHTRTDAHTYTHTDVHYMCSIVKILLHKNDFGTA